MFRECRERDIAAVGVEFRLPIRQHSNSGTIIIPADGVQHVYIKIWGGARVWIISLDSCAIRSSYSCETISSAAIHTEPRMMRTVPN